MHQYYRYLKNVPYRKIIVVSKFGACFTFDRLTFSVSWELYNVVLLLVKVLSFSGQEIKASVHQLHNRQPLLFNS